MITEETIHKAIHILAQASPAQKIILLGSYARGNAHPDSDIDLLVIEPSLKSRHQEMVRLRDLLSPLRIPVDIMVSDEDQFNQWSDQPGSYIYDAAHYGKVLYEKKS